MHGLWSPCRIMAIYAADLVSLVLVSSLGRRTADDMMVQLRSVACNTVLREIDPPLLALRMYAPQADGGRANVKEPGPDPVGRQFVQSLVRRHNRHFVYVPVGGDGWLESLSSGRKIPGDLYLYSGPLRSPKRQQCISLAGAVLEAGHGTLRGSSVA